MTNNEFLKLLADSSNIAFDFAKNFVEDELPAYFKYSVTLNASFDNPNLTQFDIYPEDNNKKVEFINETEVAILLCRNGKVPVWIDISVESVCNNQTIFRLLCAGRYSNEEKEFYYNIRGTGPFGIKSPSFPIGYVEGDKFRLKRKI